MNKHNKNNRIIDQHNDLQADTSAEEILRHKMCKWGSVKGGAINDLQSDSEGDDSDLDASVVSISVRASETLRRVGGALSESIHRRGRRNSTEPTPNTSKNTSNNKDRRRRRNSTEGRRSGGSNLLNHLNQNRPVSNNEDNDDSDDDASVASAIMKVSGKVARSVSRASQTLSKGLGKKRNGGKKQHNHYAAGYLNVKEDVTDKQSMIDESMISIDTDAVSVSSVGSQSWYDHEDDDLSESYHGRRGSTSSCLKPATRQHNRRKSVSWNLEDIEAELKKPGSGKPPRIRSWDPEHYQQDEYSDEYLNQKMPPRARSWENGHARNGRNMAVTEQEPDDYRYTSTLAAAAAPPARRSSFVEQEPDNYRYTSTLAVAAAPPPSQDPPTRRRKSGKPPRASTWDHNSKQTPWTDTIRDSRRDSCSGGEEDKKLPPKANSYGGMMRRPSCEGYESDSSPRDYLRGSTSGGIPRRRNSCQELIDESPLRRGSIRGGKKKSKGGQHQRSRVRRQSSHGGQRIRRCLSSSTHQDVQRAPDEDHEFFGYNVKIEASSDPFNGYSDVSNSEGDFEFFLEPGDYIFDDEVTLDTEAAAIGDGDVNKEKQIVALARRARILAMGAEAAQAAYTAAPPIGRRKKVEQPHKSSVARTA